MSVFMEKSVVGEWSPPFCKAESLQLQAGRFPFGQTNSRVSNKQAHGLTRSNSQMNVMCT